MCNGCENFIGRKSEKVTLFRSTPSLSTIFQLNFLYHWIIKKFSVSLMETNDAMKIRFSLALVFCLSQLTPAQNYMNLYQKSGTVQKIDLSQLDSITFSESVQPKLFSVQGSVQKGPFLSGSSITAYDLNSDLTPTGKTYNAQTKNHQGDFDLSNLDLSSNLVRLRADGFYYNEVLGQASTSQITLYALSDLKDRSSVNVNLLTSLEKPRVENLMASGATFSAAKQQAQKEILALFNISNSGMSNSEDLNIALSGEANAKLLAMTSILQGYRTEGELTELLSNIGEDMRTDGVLSNKALSSELINHALFLDTASVKTNLTKRYQAVGSTSSVPNFGTYLNQFLNNTSFVSTKSLIDYPITGINGKNLLSLSDTLYTGTASTPFSLAAKTPAGVRLTIAITSLPDSVKTTTYQTRITNDTIYDNKGNAIDVKHDSISVPVESVSLNYALWYYSVSSVVNWSISPFDQTKKYQTFTVFNSGASSDLYVILPDSGRFLIEYFENNATQARRRKIVTFKKEASPGK